MPDSIVGKADFEVATQCLPDSEFPWGIPIHLAASEGIGMILKQYCNATGAFYSGFYVDSYKLEACETKGTSRLRATFHFREGGQIQCAVLPIVYKRIKDKMVKTIKRESVTAYTYKDVKGITRVFKLPTDKDCTNDPGEQAKFNSLLAKFREAGYTDKDFTEAMLYISSQPGNFYGVDGAIENYLSNLLMILRGKDATFANGYSGLYKGFKDMVDQYSKIDREWKTIPEIARYYYILMDSRYLTY